MLLLSLTRRICIFKTSCSRRLSLAVFYVRNVEILINLLVCSQVEGTKSLLFKNFSRVSVMVHIETSLFSVFERFTDNTDLFVLNKACAWASVPWVYKFGSGSPDELSSPDSTRLDPQ